MGSIISIIQYIDDHTTLLQKWYHDWNEFKFKSNEKQQLFYWKNEFTNCKLSTWCKTFIIFNIFKNIRNLNKKKECSKLKKWLKFQILNSHYFHSLYYYFSIFFHFTTFIFDFLMKIWQINKKFILKICLIVKELPSKKIVAKVNQHHHLFLNEFFQFL